jgi:hypothetical protein
MTPYEATVLILVVGLFIVISLLPLFSTGKDYDSLVQLHE